VIVRTLRGRFVLSHILPLLIVVPLMGIALIYDLETRIVLPGLAQALEGQAAVVADLAQADPTIWTDPGRAQQFVTRLKGRLDERLMLLDTAGRLIASSDPADRHRIGQRLSPPGLAEAASGRSSVHTAESRQLDVEIVDALAPVRDPQRGVIGLVRLSIRLAGVTDLFIRLRSFIAVILLAGLVLGAAVGWTLALHLERPLRAVTGAVSNLAAGKEWVALQVEEPRELRLLAQSFNALVEHLRSLEEARHHLLANLVHELGRPLGAVRSAVQALEGGAAEDDVLRRDLLGGIDQELRRLQGLVDDLARLHDRILGTLELRRRSVSASEWLSQVLLPWREAARRKGLRWTGTVPANLPNLEMDPDRLAQALGNLLSNGIKYTSPGGAVDVSAGLQDRWLWIRVSDTGPGIAEEERARIFEPFYRGQTAHRFPQGMGLGLAIAHDVTTAHGGRLDVDSTPGHGSRFTLWLPLQPATDAPGPTGERAVP
jgi:signal transduction histidine kinase